MSVPLSDFWKLLGASRLLTVEQVQKLSAEFDQQGAADPANAKPLAQWLVGKKKLSRYQAAVLLAGRAGPFVFGDYKVHERIDQGRLAGSYRAIHTSTGHPVLLQFLTGPAANDAALWTAIRERAPAWAEIVSPHVQRVYEPATAQSFKFVVCEELRGSGLDEKIAAGRLSVAEACQIVRQAALGLAAIHAARQVHGEIRPANIWLSSPAQQPALAKLIASPLHIPAPLDFVNQPASDSLSQLADFLSPELAAPGRAPDPLTDIYALGCTLFNLLSGQPPFAGGDVQQKLARHAGEAIQPLEAQGVPAALAKIVAFAMAKKASVRFQSGTALAEQLAPFVDPAALRIVLPPASSSLTAFEQKLQQKRDSLPATAPTPPRSVSEGANARVDENAQVAENIRVAVGERSSTTAEPREAIVPADQLELSPLAGVAIATAARSEPTLGIQVSGAARPLRTSAAEIMRRRKRQQRRNLAIGAALLVLLLAGGGIAGFLFQDQLRQRLAEVTGGPVVASSSAESPGAQTAATLASKPVATSPVPPFAAPQQMPAAKVPLADDGRALWASPTSGEPISFRCVPPEAQVFLACRPAELLASEEGQRVMAGLGPLFAAQRQAFETASGLTFAEIEHLLLTLHNNDGRFPRTCFVVKTKETLTPEQLLAKWGNPAAAQEQSQKYYTGAAWAYYLPPAPEDERTFAMGAARDIQLVAAEEGRAPVVFRDIERLRRTTDSDRHFTLLFYPQFLFNDDGEPLFAAERAKIRQPLATLLGDHLQSAAASLHLGEHGYCELRMLASLDKEPYQLAQELRDKLSAVPAALEDHFVALNPPPYWKKLAFRFPSMVRDVHEHLRIGVENEQALVNSVLPASALHNLVLGGELLISTAPAAGAVVARVAPQAGGPRSIEEALQKETSYSFDSQSLEFAMSGLADDVRGSLTGAPFEFAIKIIGGDLEKDGITRNQTVRDFKQENQTVADILTALVRKANPITTVKDPSEPDQKLVWVIAADPDAPNKRIVVITTRSAAAAKKYTLPMSFVAKKK